MDISVYEGHRGRTKQNKAFKEKKSGLQWPNSKHNSTPSMACDCAPYPIDWKDKIRFAYMGGLIRATAQQLYKQGKINHKVRLGMDWNSNGAIKDHKFKDYPHFELIKPRR